MLTTHTTTLLRTRTLLRARTLTTLAALALVWILSTSPLACAQQREYQAAAGQKRLSAQQVSATVRASQADPPLNPQYYRNKKQSSMRDHHLAKYPPGVVQAASTGRVITADQRGPETAVPLTTANSSIDVVQNTPLGSTATQNITSTVCEPSLAITKHNHALVTGNWFASFAADGINFNFLNPGNTFPEPGNGIVFCCDQVVAYDAKNDTLFWFLQYTQNGSENIGRLAVVSGKDDMDNGDWRFYDFSPTDLNSSWTNEWFDFPDMTVSEEFLYITTNSFDTKGTTTTNDDSFARAIAIRLPLSQLNDYADVTPGVFSSVDAFSLRPTHGAKGKMYFGSHDFSNFGSEIDVFTWPENSNSVSKIDVAVHPWSNSSRISSGPDGLLWLNRTDFRMTGAWSTGSDAAFAWSAAQDSNFDQPHVRVAVVDMTSGQIKAQPHIWNSKLAFAYPAGAVSENGNVGISISVGGGDQTGINPSHAVGFLQSQGGQLSWQLTLTNNPNSANGPSDGRWGDYLGIRPHGGDPKTWVATGYALEGGTLPQNCVPRFVHFRMTDGGITPPPATRQRLEEMRRTLQRIRDEVDALIRELDQILQSL